MIASNTETRTKTSLAREHEYAAESVVTGKAFGQSQEVGQPVLLGFSELYHMSEVLRPQSSAVTAIISTSISLCLRFRLRRGSVSWRSLLCNRLTAAVGVRSISTISQQLGDSKYSH